MKSTIRLLVPLLLGVCAMQHATGAIPIKIGFPLEVALGTRETVELEFPTELGKIYQVEVSADLEKWAFDGYAVVGTGGPRTHITTTRNLPQLFFRVRNDGDPTRVLAGGVPGPAGPKGPQGPPGTGGLDPAAFATAEQGAKADTALQPGHTPAAIEAQAFWAVLNGTSLRDRFDRAERYPEETRISNLTSLPEIGPPWRLSIPGNNPELRPYIDKGGLRASLTTLCYLGNQVASPGKKFSLFFEFTVEPTEYTSGWNRMGLNVSFNSNPMISDSGADIYPGGVVHINCDDYAIRSINFYQNVHGYSSDRNVDTLKIPGHQYRTGDGFILDPGVPPVPLLPNVPYYAVVVSEQEVKVAATREDALAGITIDLTENVPKVQIMRAIHEPFRAVNRATPQSLWWHPQAKPLIPNKRYVMFLKVNGETLEVGIAGVGSILFENSQLPMHVGEEVTQFWWEPSGSSRGEGDSQRYKNIPKLHSVWSQPDVNTAWLSSYEGDQVANFGSDGQYSFKSPLRSFSGDGLQMRNPLPPIDIRFVAGGNGSLARGNQMLATGGHAFIEGGYLSNVGATRAGMEMIGRAPMAIDNQVIEPIRSPAAANNSLLKSVRLTPVLEPGDSEEFEYYGVLSGTQPKRILLTSQTGNQVLFDSNSIDPPLTQIEGPFTITLFRHVRAGGANTCFARFQAAGVNHLHRTTPSGIGDDPGTLNFTASAVPEGGVTLDAIKQVVHRVKNN
jgi:hypothetical protein